MVLQNCRECTDYWLKNGRNMYGYRFLSRDLHIPEAHPVDQLQPPDPLSIPPHLESPPPLSSSIPVTSQIISSDSGFEALIPSATASFWKAQECSDAVDLNPLAVGDKEKAKLTHLRFSEPTASTSTPKIDDYYFEDCCYVENETADSELPGETCIENNGESPQHKDENETADSELPVETCIENNGESPQHKHENEHEIETIDTNTSWYFPLYKSAMDGNWDTAKSIYDLHGQQVLRSKIRSHSETALHVAIGSGHRTKIFVQNMLPLISSQEDLELKTRDGSTSLGIAAKVGNVEAAMLLVKKHSKLLYIADEYENYPIHNAAEYGQKEMLLYLLQVTERGQSPDPYDPDGRGHELLRLIIRAELYDAALHLLKLMPKLATSGMESIFCLFMLAENPSAFSCWRNEGVFLPFIYTCVPILRHNRSHPRIRRAHDLESADTREYSSDNYCPYFFKRYIVSGMQRIHFLIWTLFEQIVPLLNHIKHQKLKGYHAKKLVKLLCREAAKNLQNSSDAALLFKLPLLQAAENGIYEIVKEITYSFPDAIWYSDDNNSEIFRFAIKNRHHEVYNLLHEMGDLYVNVVRQSVDDEDGDNVLHLAAYLAPDDRLRVVSGAALQMQRELQWFKEIESLVQPAYKTKRNKQGKTPQEIFTETHQNLMKEGEKWMRDTSSSCTVAATLIATIVFAAAITVPGGNNSENGKPMLSSEKALLIFGVADALSLFTSCVSILMFLSILTSRYAEGDFVRALPTRLIVGLLTLFLSVASMLAAFSATLYLMFGDRRRWIVGCVIGPSCLIVGVFASMQFSLLVEMIKSTYRCSIFKRSWTSKKAMKCIKKSGFNCFWH